MRPLEEPVNRCTHILIVRLAHHTRSDLPLFVDHDGAGNDVAETEFAQRVEVRAGPDVEIDFEPAQERFDLCSGSSRRRSDTATNWTFLPCVRLRELRRAAAARPGMARTKWPRS